MGSLGEGLAGLRLGGSQVLVTGASVGFQHRGRCDKQGMGIPLPSSQCGYSSANCSTRSESSWVDNNDLGGA